MNTQVVAIANQKGGVSKTTTSQALITGLSNKGYRVLGIDFDPQGNLSYSLGTSTEEPTIYNVLKNETKMSEAVQTVDNFDVLPSNILLSGVEVEFTQTGREYLLKEALQEIKSNYDFIIIDTPPSLSLLTINAFTTANFILIPMLADVFSMQGIAQLNSTINQVKKYCNPHLSIIGILLTKFTTRQNLNKGIKETIEQLADQLNTKLFGTYIRESVSIREAQIEQKNILSDLKSNSAIDYNNFVEEFLREVEGI